jgi:signal transduction histidine kinase
MARAKNNDLSQDTGAPVKKQKYFEDQFDDEEVLFVFRKHPVVMRKGLVFGMLGPLVGVLPAAIKPDLGFGFFFGGLAAGFLLGILIFIPSWIGWHFSVFIVTDQRLIQITQKGMFHRSVIDMGLNQIQMVNYEVAGLQETLLGFGTISMQTFVGDLVIHDIHHPGKIQKKLLKILREQGIAANAYPMNLDDVADAAEQDET